MRTLTKCIPLKVLLALVVAPFLLLTSCRQPESAVVRVGEGAPGVSEKAIPSYASMKTQIFEKYCLDCHQGSRVNRTKLSTLAEIKAQLSEIKHRVFEENDPAKKMPPRGEIEASLKAALLRWIEAGAPEEGESTAPPAEQKPTEVSFAVVYKAVIAPRCLKCHFKDNTEGLDGFSAISNFDNYENVQKMASSIFKLAAVKNEMPPAPTGLAEGSPNPRALTIAEKQVLADWIVQGMKP